MVTRNANKSDAAVRRGWTDELRDDNDVVELRKYLASNNGIKGLEILEQDGVERAVELVLRDGFVVVGDILNDEQIDILASGCNDVINALLALD